MDEDEVTLEDGEISDDSVQTYTPLERPANYSAVQPMTRFPVKIQDSESEEMQSSDSDSDSDNVHKVKKPKIKLKPKLIPHNSKRKKFDIWSTKMQEDVLSANLDNCDVTTKDKSRAVESYDYSLAGKYYSEMEDRKSNKRTREDRKNNHFRSRKRSSSSEKVKGNARLIAELTVGVTNSDEEIARDIANKLCEERDDLILKVINAMGKEKSIDIFNETKRLEQEGGMLIMNQTRRRTPGGVFLFLVRNDYHITPEQKELIFEQEKQRSKRESKEKQRRKSLKIKNEIAAAKAKLMPDLLTRAELLVSDNNRARKETNSDANVINPPPTPETDCHDNSGDGMDGPSIAVNGNDSLDDSRGKLQSYDDDYLDIGCSNDMDLF